MVHAEQDGWTSLALPAKSGFCVRETGTERGINARQGLAGDEGCHSHFERDWATLQECFDLTR